MFYVVVVCASEGGKKIPTALNLLLKKDTLHPREDRLVPQSMGSLILRLFV